MSVLTDLASAEVKLGVNQLTGELLTRPTLLMSEGNALTYACDVKILEWDVTGKINQYKRDGKEGARATYITGLPGQHPEDWQLEDSLPGHVDTTLHNVPIARSNLQLIHGDVGNAVLLERSQSGWQIVGFAVELPGTHRMYPVDLGSMSIGPVIDMSVDTRLLTLAEIGELRPFGDLPFGASAIYQAGKMVRIV